MYVFKPKGTVYIILAVSLLIGIGVPFLIYQQVLDQSSTVQIKNDEWVRILLPTFFVLGAIRVLLVMKTIEIDLERGIWSVRYWLTRKELLFSIPDIQSITLNQSIGRKSGTISSTYFITLKNAKQVKISSNEITEFEMLELYLQDHKYKSFFENTAV